MHLMYDLTMYSKQLYFILVIYHIHVKNHFFHSISWHISEILILIVQHYFIILH